MDYNPPTIEDCRPLYVVDIDRDIVDVNYVVEIIVEIIVEIDIFVVIFVVVL